ncbi:NifB/NifX family molybdenum-iron cluster-binding protein [bacterium]|nr:NifB/NifX family molybdenum-iron cluster-binding protein [bacterium]
MKIAVSAQGSDLTSAVDPRFGRAAHFIIYDTDNKTFDLIDNAENIAAAQGAGIQAAQQIAQHAVDVVVSGNMGPKAFQALQAAGVQMVSWCDGTVAEAVELVEKGELKPITEANTRGHWR